VYLPAIVGYVPNEIIKCLAAFLDACYIVRRQVIDQDTLETLDSRLREFWGQREIFRASGVRPTGFSLPRQHSLMHYRRQIEDFGVPGGLCSSITESRHITAVKKPWRRSNRYNALGQMLATIQRLDKFAALRSNFAARGMIPAGHATSGGEIRLLHPRELIPTKHGEAAKDQDQDQEIYDSDKDDGWSKDMNTLRHVKLAQRCGKSIFNYFWEFPTYSLKCTIIPTI
jgi:hypothetical protein